MDIRRKATPSLGGCNELGCEENGVIAVTIEGLHDEAAYGDINYCSTHFTQFLKMLNDFSNR